MSFHLPLYITSSRKPSVLTRRLIRTLAHLVGAVIENRGKRDFDAIAERAAHFGCTRLALVYESHGNPSRIAFYDLLGNKWIEPEVNISHYKLVDQKFKRANSFKAIPIDKNGGQVLELFGIAPGDEPGECEVRASGEKLEFVVRNQTVLEVFVSTKSRAEWGL